MVKDLYRLSLNFEKKRNNELRISAQELTSKLVALLFYKRQILDDEQSSILGLEYHVEEV